MPLPSANKAAHSGFETRGDITRSPKQGYQWSHKKDLSKSSKKKIFLKNAWQHQFVVSNSPSDYSSGLLMPLSFCVIILKSPPYSDSLAFMFMGCNDQALYVTHLRTELMLNLLKFHRTLFVHCLCKISSHSPDSQEIQRHGDPCGRIRASFNGKKSFNKPRTYVKHYLKIIKTHVKVSGHCSKI